MHLHYSLSRHRLSGSMSGRGLGLNSHWDRGSGEVEDYFNFLSCLNTYTDILCPFHIETINTLYLFVDNV